MRPALVLLVALPLVLAGCTEKGSDAPEPGSVREQLTGSATPEQRATNALAAVSEDMGADGDIRKMTMTATGGGYTGSIVLELGADDTSSLSMDASGFSFLLVCSDETGVLRFGEKTYEARAGAFCEEGRFVTDDESQDPFDTVTFEEDENVRIVSVTPQPDGGARIDMEVRGGVETEEDAEDGGADAGDDAANEGNDDEELVMTYVVYTDARNRVVNMTMDAPTGEGRYEAAFEYGERRALEVPEADARIPARVEHDEDFRDGVYSWRVDEAEDAVALSEFEVRVWTREAAEEGTDEAGGDDAFSFRGRPTPTTPHLAAFALEADGAQASEGFSFAFEDDGDGLLGEGDAFTLERDGWETEDEYVVVVFDEWAGRGLDDNPVPAPWVLASLGALAAAALVRRRG